MEEYIATLTLEELLRVGAVPNDPTYRILQEKVEKESQVSELYSYLQKAAILSEPITLKLNFAPVLYYPGTRIYSEFTGRLADLSIVNEPPPSMAKNLPKRSMLEVKISTSE
jgi:hypothetical protein